MKNDRIKELFIESSASIIAAMQQMDRVKHKLLIVVEADKYYSLLSIGDIQRAIIANISTNEPIKQILRQDVKVAYTTDDKEEIIKSIKERRNEFMPIVDDEKRIVDVIFWEDLFANEERTAFSSLQLPVVIMAGGKGIRLRPLTNVLPKPLIPIGNQTMLEDIMDRFVAVGCDDFYISVNYKAELIKDYLINLKNPNYRLSFFQEDKPLGTAGSLHLLQNKINSTFFVSNCDIIIDEDYGEILNYHKEIKNEITVVAALKNYSIPYGTLETVDSGRLISIQEKPDMIFKINTGMYVLEPHLINEIPKDSVFHITHLIEKLIKENRNVGVFPINEGSWTDIGSWEEYRKFFK